jgi:hypothetical protein
MDTKSMHDVLIEDGFDLKIYESNEWEDAAAVWVDHMMKTPEWLNDFWIDMLCELHGDDEKYALATLLGHIGKITPRLDDVRKAESHTGLNMANSAALTMQASFLGAEVYKAIEKGVKKHMSAHGHEYFEDVLNHAAQLEQDNEAERGDWEYEQMRDRQMEERA